MLSQSLYSHKELEYKNSTDMELMCKLKGIDWNELDSCKKRGSTIIKQGEWQIVETPDVFNDGYFNTIIPNTN